MGLKLHHRSQRIAPGSLDFVLDLFGRFGFEVLERSKTKEVAWVAQKETKFVLQFAESDQSPLPTQSKLFSHIGFIAGDPKGEVENIKQWIQSRGIAVVEGSWTNKELWIDCPDLFVDFVLEVMHKSIVE